MAAIVDTILRALLFLFSVVALGLTAGWVHEDPSSSRISFAVFAAAFSIIFPVLYGLAAAFIENIAFPLVSAIIDALNAIFLFAAATAVAVKVGAGNCSNRPHVKGPGIITVKECRLGQASAAFLYFAFFTSLGNLIYSVIASANSGSIGTPGRKSQLPRTGIPTASQA